MEVRSQFGDGVEAGVEVPVGGEFQAGDEDHLGGQTWAVGKAQPGAEFGGEFQAGGKAHLGAQVWAGGEVRADKVGKDPSLEMRSKQEVEVR